MKREVVVLILVLVLLIIGCTPEKVMPVPIVQEQSPVIDQDKNVVANSDDFSKNNVDGSAVVSDVKPAWGKSVTVTTSGDYMVVLSNGIPDHGTGTFPMTIDTNHDGRPDNPNSITAQNYQFKIPLLPKKAVKTTDLPMGPIAVTLDGVVFFNPLNAEGQDAVKVEVFDSCQGHPEMQGRYHYHQLSHCLDIDNAGHSHIVGYAFDGFAIYGPQEDTEIIPADLDTCNGHENNELGYHYHTASKYPYVLGCYAGVVETSNFDSTPQAGQPKRPPPPR
jgi:hypothetical protein